MMSQTPCHAYQELESIFKHYYYLKRTLSLLNWDSAVMLPKKAHKIRGSQVAALEIQLQNVLSGANIGKLLQTAQAESAALNDWQQANLREMEQLYRIHHTIPKNLQSAFSNQAVQTENAWREAKQDNNLSLFLPTFGKLLEYVKRRADCLAKAFNSTPYEGLLIEYDTYYSESTLDSAFEKLATTIPSFLQNTTRKELAPLPIISIPIQKRLCRRIMRDVGFDFAYGRLDKSAHPFTEGGRGDSRITTNYDKQHFLNTLMGVIHECGHALYDTHLPREWFDQPVGYDLGMPMHEAIALFYEFAISRTPEFANYLAQLLQREKVNMSREEVTQHLMTAQPGCIRIEADELSYSLHIVLRYKLEKMLVDNKIALNDIHEFWNAEMQKLLGVKPASASAGMLQDIHWSLGLFGYFPSYALGAMTAGKLYRKVSQQITDFPTQLSNGSFTPLLNWLTQEIFSRGRFESLRAIHEKTNLQDEVNHYLKYLTQKYIA